MSTFLMLLGTPELCAICRKVAGGMGFLSRYSEINLKISAARNCPLCRFFYTEFVVNVMKTNDTQQAWLEVRRYDTGLRVDDYNKIPHHFEIFADEDTPQSSPAEYRQIQAHPNLQPCWDLIHAWTSKCLSNHSACRQEYRSEKPTRLIDTETLRLVDGAWCDETERYATLSHCWGQRSFLELRQETLHMFRSGIDFHSLPPNFRDAIFATRKLGIRYLWIDGLCVIQSDLNDWLQEAGRMGLYYRRAFITISLLSAPDAHTGFLNPRSQRPAISMENGLYFRQARPSWSEIFRTSVLSTRAWALQERLLCTRIVHFEKGELFWECLETSAREGRFPENSPEHTRGIEWTDESFKRSLAFDSFLLEQWEPDDKIAMIMEQWDRILCQYSTLGLTNHRDIFPAIAGIAEKFHEITRFTYLSGLWKEYILETLLWYPDTSTENRYYVRYGDEIPSWSWASLGKPFKMLYSQYPIAEAAFSETKLLDAPMIATKLPQAFAMCNCLELHLSAAYFKVWCRSSSNGHAPYSDPYLQMVLEIFDEQGAFVGTGFWDRLPETHLVQCTAVVVLQRLVRTLSKIPITYFLLVNDAGDYMTRIGVGQTADQMHGRVSTALDLDRCARKRIVLR